MLDRGNGFKLTLKHLEHARRKLSQGKALGLDLLSDTWLKNRQIFDQMKHQFLEVFQAWYDGKEIPEFIKTGRIFALSKEETEYPRKGKIRTISILPALTKLYELVIL